MCRQTKSQNPHRHSKPEREPHAKPSACDECARLCHSLHWNRSDLYPRVYRFFKIMLGKDYDKELIVPPKFKAIVEDLVGKKTYLEDVHGVHYGVTLSSLRGGLGFKRGWNDFASKHNLTRGNFLWFTYIKGSHFLVNIFDSSACEKLCNVARKRNPGKGNAPTQAAPSLNSSDASRSRYQPSAAERTQDSGGNNLNLPSSDSADDTDSIEGCFELRKRKQAADAEKSRDTGVGTSNAAHYAMKSQAEANRDCNGTRNCNSNTNTKETDVGMTKKGKFLEGTADRTHNCVKEQRANLLNSSSLGAFGEPGGKGNIGNLELGNDRSLGCKNKLPAELSNSIRLDPSSAKLGRKAGAVPKVRMQPQSGNGQSSPCINEGAAFNNSGQAFNGAIKERVKREPEETSEQVNGHAKRKRDLVLVSDVVANCKQVKTELMDYDVTFSCLAVVDAQQHCLVLPSELPAVIPRKKGPVNRSVMLQDEEGRLWPAIHYTNVGSDLHLLEANWDLFNREFGIQAGDRYVFTVEDVYECLYKIKVCSSSSVVG